MTRTYEKKPSRYHTKLIKKPISEAELEARRKLIPEDTRDYTARMFGDPIPNDPRRLEVETDQPKDNWSF